MGRPQGPRDLLGVDEAVLQLCQGSMALGFYAAVAESLSVDSVQIWWPSYRSSRGGARCLLCP